MLILFVRHGIAEDDSPDGSDAARRLTSEGEHRTAEVARGLARQIDPPEVILSSPKVRARQTAAIFGEVLQRSPQTLEVLAEGPATNVLAAVARRSEQSVMLVGHEPTLSQMMELILGMRGRSIAMKRAGVGCIDVTFNHRHHVESACLLFLATPRLLRAGA